MDKFQKTASSPMHPAPVPELSVVIPCYNEAERIESLLRDWSAAVEPVVPSYEFVVVNDGSSDGTGKTLDRLRKELKSIRVIHQLNGGHSRAIRRGYELARGRYILQVDSNRLYEPSDFLPFWERRLAFQLILGFRTNWIAGTVRRFLANLLGWWVSFLFGSKLQDPNVPFRLFRREIGLSYLAKTPTDFEGINLALSILTQRDYPDGVCELPLPNRQRIGPGSHTSLTSFVFLITHFLAEVTQLRFSKRFAPSGGRLARTAPLS